MSSNQTVIDLCTDNPSVPSLARKFSGFSGINWSEFTLMDDQILYGAAFFYKVNNVGDLPTSTTTRLKAFLMNFTQQQLLLAYGFLGGQSADAPNSRRAAIKSVANLILAKSQHTSGQQLTVSAANTTIPAANTTNVKSSPTDMVAESSVVTLSPTKRSKSKTKTKR